MYCSLQNTNNEFLMILTFKTLRSDILNRYIKQIYATHSTIRVKAVPTCPESDVHTQHSLKLHKRRVHTDLRQHFFTERVINNWNSLNEEIVSAISINSFKRKLQKIYMVGSFQRLVKSAWPSGPSQIPGEAQTGKLTGKLTGVMSQDFGVLVTARAREFWTFWRLFIWGCGRL